MQDIETRDKLQRLRGHESLKAGIKLSESKIEHESSSVSDLSEKYQHQKKVNSIKFINFLSKRNLFLAFLSFNIQ